MLVKQQKPTPERVKYRYSGMTVRGALITIAERFGASFKRFTWSGRSICVDQALEEIDPALLDMPCGSFGVVGFGGGPPDNYRQFQGTMLTVLCDLALFEYYNPQPGI